MMQLTDSQLEREEKNERGEIRTRRHGTGGGK